MIKINKLSLLFVCISFLSACCSTAKFNNNLTRNELTPQNATIKVSRSGTWVGGAIQIGIQDAMTNIGELGPGGELTWSRPSGYLALITTIASINTTHVIIFSVEAGKTYSFEMEMFYGGKTILHPNNVSKDKIVYEVIAESYKEPIPDELWKTELAKLNNTKLVTEQNPIEPNLNVKTTPPDTATQQVPVKTALSVDKKPQSDSTDSFVWTDTLPDNETYGKKIPPGTLILYTATGKSQKEIVGFKDGMVLGWNACGKPAVWIHDKLFEDGSSRVNRLAARMAVLRDEAEKAGFYYTLTDYWKEVFQRNSYPNSIKKLRIEPGMTLAEALANVKCRQSPNDKK